MTNEQEHKLKAGGKIAYGTARTISGGALALEHGLLSVVLTTPAARIPFARAMMESGQKSVKEGVAEWNR